jgi:hypothetical protein
VNLEAPSKHVRYEEWRRRAEGSQPVKSTRLVTDVKMRGSLDAFGLARLVTNLWPDIGIEVAPGILFQGREDLPKHAFFLRNPYQPTALIDAVRNVTNSSIVTLLRVAPPPEAAA